MNSLVTLEQAKAHLRVVMSDYDDDIQLKCEQATAIVIDYLKIATVTWTMDTVPQQVQAAILLALEDLHEHRPIDWELQRRLLERSRDPALA
jgi:hypothetical protein